MISVSLDGLWRVDLEVFMELAYDAGFGSGVDGGTTTAVGAEDTRHVDDASC